MDKMFVELVLATLVSLLFGDDLSMPGEHHAGLTQGWRGSSQDPTVLVSAMCIFLCMVRRSFSIFNYPECPHGVTQRYAEEGMPDDAAQLKERLEGYRQMLGTLGMRDYQVKTVANL